MNCAPALGLKVATAVIDWCIVGKQRAQTAADVRTLYSLGSKGRTKMATEKENKFWSNRTNGATELGISATDTSRMRFSSFTAEGIKETYIYNSPEKYVGEAAT